MKSSLVSCVILACVIGCGGSTSSGGDTPSDASGDSTVTSDSASGDSTSVIDSTSLDTAPSIDTTPADTTPKLDTGGGACKADGTCAVPLKCCDAVCIYDRNDPFNCGGCGVRCSGATPMCSGGTCVAAKCAPSCGASQQCCEVPGPGPTGGPKCVDGATCPIGCPLCK